MAKTKEQYEAFRRNWKGSQPVDTSGYQRTAKGVERQEDFSPSGYTENALPNYDKLTRSEQWMMDKLPKVAAWADPVTSKMEDWQQTLERNNMKWISSGMGKVLQAFDLFGEGIERSSGMIAQWAHAMQTDTEADFLSHLGDAWSASSFTADMTNMPTIKWKSDDIGVEGFSNWRPVGIHTPDDLPGVENLANVRHQFAGLVDSGMSRKDALTEIQNAYYADLGALAIRAQKQDMIYHIFGDITMYVGGPLSWAKKFRPIADGKMSVELMIRQAKKLDELTDALRISQEGLATARAAGKTGTEMAEALGKTKKIRGQLRVSQDAQKLFDAGVESGKVMGLKDKMALFLTGGGDPAAVEFLKDGGKIPWYLKNYVQEGLTKIPLAGKPIAKLFKLTPEAQAWEALDMFKQALGGTIRNAKTPEEAVTAVRTFAETINGKAFAHAYFTTQGQAVQSMMKRGIIDAEDMLKNWQKFSPQRSILETIRDVVRKKIFENPNGLDDIALKTQIDEMHTGRILTILLDKESDGVNAIRSLMRTAGVESGAIDDLASILTKNFDDFKALGNADVPTMQKSFMEMLANRMNDAGARVAVEKFGIQEHGQWTRMVQAVKTAETLAFLRLNPGYVIRNVINNEATMLARGILGWMGRDKIDELYDFLGDMQPVRQLLEGMDAAAPQAGYLTNSVMNGLDDQFRAGNRITQAIRGEYKKVKGVFQEVKLRKEGRGKFEEFSRKVSQLGHKDGKPAAWDMFRYSQRVETNASRRAFGTAWAQGWKRQYWVAGVGFDAPADFGKLATHLDDAQMDVVRSAVAGTNPTKSFDDLLRTDLSKQAGYLMDRFKSNHGVNPADIFPDDFMLDLERGLQEVFDTGDVSSIERLFDDHVAEYSEFLTQEFERKAADMLDRASLIVGGSGPEGAAHMVSEVLDDYHKSNIIHNLTMRDLKVLEGGDDVARQAFWAKHGKVTKEAWERRTIAAESVMRGIEDAVKAQYGKSKNMQDMAYISRNGLEEIQGGWKKYFVDKDDATEKFFKELSAARAAEAKAKKPKYIEFPQAEWDKIVESNDVEYLKMLDMEYEQRGRIDNAVISMIPDEELQDAIAVQRGLLRAGVLDDRRRVQAFQQKVKGMNFAERQVAYKEHFTARVVAWREGDELNQLARQALQGDKNAITELLARDVANIHAPRWRGFKRLRPYDLHTKPRAHVVNRVNKALAGPPPWNGTDDIVTGMSVQVTAQGKTARVIGEGKPTKAGTPTFRVEFEDGFKRDYVAKSMGTPPPRRVPRDIPDAPSFDTTGMSVDDIAAHELTMLRQAATGDKPEIQSLVDEIMDMGVDSPTSTHGDRIIDGVKVNVSVLGDKMYLGTIEAIAPGEGAGTTVLNKIQRMADEAGVDISLYPEKIGATEVEQLAEWYTRNGFVKEGAGRAMIYRAEDPLYQAREMRSIADVMALPDDELDAAFNSIGVYKKPIIADTDTLQPPSTLDDLLPQVDNEPQMQFIQQEMAEGKGFDMLAQLRDDAVDSYHAPRLTMADNLSEDGLAELERYLGHVNGQMSEAITATNKYAMGMRDSALLNYQKQNNFQAMLGNVMPFSFWTTESAYKWAMSAFDRPHVIGNYLRMEKFMRTAGAPEHGFPSRLEGKMRLNAPFLPSFMNNNGLWIDPLRSIFPLREWADTYDEFTKGDAKHVERTQNLLQQMASRGEISVVDLNEATQSQSGTAWMQAYAQTDYEEKQDPLDFMSMISSPHVPITWGYKFLTGKQDELGPSMPLSRNVKKLYGLFGVDPINHEGFATDLWGVGATMRQHLGLPAYDQWDGYRVELMLTNMVADGELTISEMQQAMVDGSGGAWEEAASRAAMAYAKGGITSDMSTADKLKNMAWWTVSAFVFPTQTYPEGEKVNRQLKDDFGRAYIEQENGNPEALREFFDENPSYEGRLALWKTPEERMQSFMTGITYDKFYELKTVDQFIIKEAGGEDFKRFLSGGTATAEQMAYWTKLMGGETLGGLAEDVRPIEFAPPEIAQQAQEFYDIRNAVFSTYRDLQNEYYSFPEGGVLRRDFKRENPELWHYWKWRNEFFLRNPEILPYVNDDYKLKYPSAQAERQAFEPGPQFSWSEWSYVLGSSAARNVVATGEIPASVMDMIEDKALELGLSVDTLIQQVQSAE